METQTWRVKRCKSNRKMTYAIAVAICLQVEAHWRHISAQAFIWASSPMRSQSWAQRSQISPQTPQVRPWNSEPLSIKLALVWQISAQSSINRMWAGSACWPPFCKQYVTVLKQMLWQSKQFWMHGCISWAVSLSESCCIGIVFTFW